MQRRKGAETQRRKDFFNRAEWVLTPALTGFRSPERIFHVPSVFENIRGGIGRTRCRKIEDVRW
jgi:hypothetical protein